MEKIKIIVIMTFILFLLVSIMGEKKPQQNEQQLQCEHEWIEIAWNAEWCSDGSGVSHNIYCPKCHWETKVSYKEWNKIQVDMNYKDN